MKQSSDSRRLVAACCGLMFAYGCYLGGSQALIGGISEGLGLDIAGMGSLVSLQFLPVAFVPVLMGGLADRIGRKRILTAFCALFGAGLLICRAARCTWVYGLGIVAVGAAYSVCESTCCAAMSDLGPEWGARGINLSQALLCLGAVLAPQLIRLGDIGWRTAFLIFAACFAALLPALLALRFPKPLPPQAGDRGGVRALLASRAFLCLFVGILLYVGLESGFGYFIESLISDRFGRVEVSGVSLYWLGMMLSRFLFSSMRYPVKPVLVGGFALSGALFLLLIACASPGLSVALCFATGFAFGPIWSTLVAEANARHADHAGAASGLMSAGCGVGGILFPALTGLAARSFSLAAAFGLMSVVALAGTALCAMLPPRK